MSYGRISYSEIPGGYVSTIRCDDGEKPYETAITSPLYADGEIIVVEAYDTEAQARAGHGKWDALMIHNPPNVIVECCNSHISKVLAIVSEQGANIYERSWKR